MNKIKISEERMMTLDEHREMGKILQYIRNILVVKSVEIDGIYGKTKGLGTKLERATKIIDAVRSQLDDKLFNEYPDLEDKDGCEYYY